MGLIILRLIFVFVAAGISVALINSDALPIEYTWLPWATFTGVMAIALAVIIIDMLVPRKQIAVVSSVYFGILIGLLLTYVISIALAPILESNLVLSEMQNVIRMSLGMYLCYICISVLMQTQGDFRFIIPFVEFAREMKGLKPYILDTSVVIDGRIADVLETQIIDNPLIMPRFVLNELQAIADSSEKLRRTRGRRGLDILNRLQNDEHIDLRVDDRETLEMENQPVDMKLVIMAKDLQGKVVTGDYNLNKVAKLHDVEVINLNDLANSLKPVFLPGEEVEVRIVKAGEEADQGVGYLDDGTMIVIQGGRNHINENVQISVTSVLQTSAGRMVFGRIENAANTQH